MSIYELKPRFQALLRPLVGAPARAWASRPTRSRSRPARSRSRSACGSSSPRAAAGRLRADPAVDVPAHGLQRHRRHAGARVRPAERAGRLSQRADRRALGRRALPAVCAGRAVQPVLGRHRDRAGRPVANSPARSGPTVGASRRYDGPLGKSDRAFVFGALGLWVALGGPLPAWTRVADAAAGRCWSPGPSSTASAARWPRPEPHRAAERHDRHERRPRAPHERTSSTHDGVVAVLPALAGRPAPRGAARSCCSIAATSIRRAHGAPGRRARPARLRLLRLGRARPRPLAGRSAASARASRPRCATCRPSSTTSAARTASPPEDIARDRAERGRGAGRDLGARLRAAGARADARLAGLQGQALRAVRARRARR